MQKGEIPILSTLGKKCVCQENKVWENSILLGIFLNFVQETTYKKNIYPEAAIDLLVNYISVLVVNNIFVQSMNEGGKKKASRQFLHLLYHKTFLYYILVRLHLFCQAQVRTKSFSVLICMESGVLVYSVQFWAHQYRIDMKLLDSLAKGR